MQGHDKGLLPYQGQPLVQHALRRLRPQVGALAISANRNLHQYEALAPDVPVWRDSLPGFHGPLAGWLTGLERCATPFLASVPCDSPDFPPDLVQRLAGALEAAGCGIAIARTPGREQPAFALMRCALAPQLRLDLAGGERKVLAWVQRRAHVMVTFADADAFRNLNTPQDLAGA